MQEAFRQAIEKNPDSSLAPVIKKAIQAQTAEAFNQRQEKRFAQPRKQKTRYDTQDDIFLGHIPMNKEEKNDNKT